LKIFCDLAANDATLTLLKDGVTPHELVFPAAPAPSVLSKSGSDPALADADIAFGQPDAAAVLNASKLRWLHIPAPATLATTRLNSIKLPRSGS
jgi:hypothetical protein